MLVKQDESSSILQLLQLSILTFYIDLILQLVLQNKNKTQQIQTPLPNMS